MKKKCEKWKICHFPLYIQDWDYEGQDYVFVKLPTYNIFISLILEIHKNKTWSMKTKLVCDRLNTLIYY